MVSILHHGAVTGVTGSCHQLVLGSDTSVLIDCGLFQGAESAERELSNQQIDFPIDTVKALFITHCHIDHVGRLPWLLAAGFDGPVYASEATARLLPLVIEDALKLGVTRDKQLIDRVIHRLEQMLVPLKYGVWLSTPFGQSVVNQVLKVRYQPAGHILGSAYLEFKYQGEIIVFSGDLGAPYAPLLPAPKSPWRADRLVIESTYGDKLHENRKQRRLLLKQIIERSLMNSGTVLIPAFSIGRTQELLYELESIIHSSKQSDWQQIDIIVDSPLAAKFTECYRELQYLWDAEAQKRKRAGRHPLSFDQLITVESHQQHMTLVNYLQQSGRSSIVVAASGMCAGGRMVNYLKALLPDARTDVLFVGYQEKGTPGRDIQQYGPKGGYVYLDDERIDINAAVHTIGGYSAHADQKDLVNFVKRMRHKPNEIRIVHGEQEAKLKYQSLLADVVPDARIVIPDK